MKKLLILIVIITLSLAHNCPKRDKVVICYYASWAVYREGIGQFNTTNIDSTLCTHIVYTFAGLNLESQISSLDPQNDVVRGSYNSFTKLKQENPCLKTLLAIGGWNEGSKKYSVMAYSDKSRESFAESVLRFLVTYDFDGLDFDWEYPTQRGGIPADRDNFVETLKLLHEKLKIWNLTLTIAVPIQYTVAYNILQISRYVDYVLLMAYDFTSGDSNVTGLSAPLNEIQKSANEWLKFLPPSKLILGISTYARSFTLKDEKQTEIGALTAGFGPAGKYTKEPGFLSSYEVQQKLATRRYTVVKTDAANYYAYYKKEWLSFELADTITEKVKYALDFQFGGAMVWTIDTDDFRGIYNKTSFPILRIVNQVLYT